MDSPVATADSPPAAEEVLPGDVATVDDAAGSTAGFAVADSVVGAAAGADSVLGAVGASTARTAVWQDDERLDMFFCRHCSEAAPPGGMLAQWAS